MSNTNCEKKRFIMREFNKRKYPKRLCSVNNNARDGRSTRPVGRLVFTPSKRTLLQGWPVSLFVSLFWKLFLLPLQSNDTVQCLFLCFVLARSQMRGKSGSSKGWSRVLVTKVTLHHTPHIFAFPSTDPELGKYFHFVVPECLKPTTYFSFKPNAKNASVF